MEYIEQVKALMRAGRPSDAVGILVRRLDIEPQDYLALLGLADIEYTRGKAGLTSHMFKRVAEMARLSGDMTTSALAVNGMGRCFDDMGDLEMSFTAFSEALNLMPDDFHCLNNVGLTQFKRGDTDGALETLRAAAKKEPNRQSVNLNLAMAHLKKRDWSTGWSHWERALGSPDRPSREDLASLPKWYYDPHAAKAGDEGAEDNMFVLPQGDSVPVMCYGEQGIGDEVLFASCLPDFCDVVEKPVIETDPRLRSLFARSFPKAAVHGTRGMAPHWLPSSGVGEKVAIGSLPAAFRVAGQFPGTPYLVPDPDRVRMVRALLDDLPGKKVGLAWHGGTMRTGIADRSLHLAEMMGGLGDTTDTTFVSLQYQDATDEVAAFDNVHQFPYLTLTSDYDDTAALVSSLDAVICVATAVVNLSGALGTPTWVLVPDGAPWRYPDDVDKHPWFNNVNLVRKTDGGWRVRNAYEAATAA